jgi:hypothetical protein
MSRQCKIETISEYVSFNFYLYIELKCIVLTLHLIRELHIGKILNDNNSSNSDSLGAIHVIFAHTPVVHPQAQVQQPDSEYLSNDSVSLPPIRPTSEVALCPLLP